MTGEEPFVSRRQHDLARKLASIDDELAAWARLTQPGQRLEKHHTQVARMARQLGALAVKVRGEVARAAADGTLIARARELEQAALGLHRIWQFYRSKLALRLADWFAEPLLVADEIAWDCYARVRALALPPPGDDDAMARLREPPLVFFNGGGSPFTQPRDAPYEAERVPGEAASPQIDLVRILRHLPFPVIGIPWYQGRHLCDLVVLAHEVGHNIENDFALAPEIAARIAAAVPAERAAAWTAWARELFADLCGALAGGPAFVSSLLDFVVVDPQAARDEMRFPPDWGKYPPAALRARFNAAVLAHQGFAPDRDPLLAPWLAACAGHALPRYDEDLPALVRALIEGGYAGLGGRPLTAALSFGPAAHAAAQEAATEALGARTPASRNVRVLAAAARLAYVTDPGAYGDEPAAKLLAAMRDAVPGGVRGPGGDRTAEADADPDARARRLRAVEAADRGTGDWLFDALTRPEPPVQPAAP